MSNKMVNQINLSNELKLIVFISPAFISTILGSGCRIGTYENPTTSNLNPPSFVFGIVWPILYTLIGYSWYRSITDKNKDQYLYFFSYLILSIALGLWIRVYGSGAGCLGNRKLGFYTIVICVGITLAIISIEDNINRLLMIPLFTWLLIASFVNANQVTITPQK